MKKISIFLAGIVSGFLLSAQPINDPNAEVRQVKNFTAINVSNAFDVYLLQSKEEGVAVSSTNNKDNENIKVEVKSGVLHISYEARNKMGWNNGKKKLKAYISFINISKLVISGACNVFISGTLKANELSINQSGASDLIGKLSVNHLIVDLGEASDITLSGTAKFLSVVANKASDFKGFDLVSETCNAKASGASDIKITVNNELSAQASGASDVKYRGKCEVKEIKSSGSSSITKG